MVQLSWATWAFVKIRKPRGGSLNLGLHCSLHPACLPHPGKPPLCSQAITARDSMAKSLYSALFDWIVLRINHALLNKKDMEEAVSVSA